MNQKRLDGSRSSLEQLDFEPIECPSHLFCLSKFNFESVEPSTFSVNSYPKHANLFRLPFE